MLHRLENDWDQIDHDDWEHVMAEDEEKEAVMVTTQSKKSKETKTSKGQHAQSKRDEEAITEMSLMGFIDGAGIIIVGIESTVEAQSCLDEIENIRRQFDKLEMNSTARKDIQRTVRKKQISRQVQSIRKQVKQMVAGDM